MPPRDGGALSDSEMKAHPLWPLVCVLGEIAQRVAAAEPTNAERSTPERPAA